MRAAVLLIATALVVACSKPAPGPDASTAAAHVSAAANAGALIGVWSLGGTCAADDGVELRADGSAWVSGHGEGLWALDKDGRVVFVLREVDMGAEPDPNAPRSALMLTLTAPPGDHLVGALSDGTQVNARRCPPPETPPAAP